MLRDRWFADSPVEGSGFEPSVPLPRLSSIRAVRAEIIGRSTDVFRRDREFDVSALQRGIRRSFCGARGRAVVWGRQSGSAGGFLTLATARQDAATVARPHRAADRVSYP